MTTLVIAQATYAVNCRYILGSAMHPSAWWENPWVLGMVLLNAALQCFLVYTPGVNKTWDMTGIDANAWGRVILLSFALFYFIEFEKWAGPRFMWPLLKPCFERVFKPKARSMDRLSAAAGQTAAAAAEGGEAAHGEAAPKSVEGEAAASV